MVGTWRLVSYIATDTSQQCVAHPLGAAPRGLLIYTADGHMSAQVAGVGSRTGLKDPAEPGTSLDRPLYVGYGGIYEQHGDQVIHRTVLGSLPEVDRADVTRTVEVKGDTLILRAPSAVREWDEVVLTWRRVRETLLAATAT